MNARDFKPIFKELLPRLPGFVAHKRLTFMMPINGLLRGILFDASAYGKDDFYVQTVIMPLGVPIDHLSLLFGFRVRHPTEGWGWTRRLPNLVETLDLCIKAQALPFLEPVRTADDFALMARSYWGNIHAPERTAYVLARDGQIQRAIAIIDDLLPKITLDVEWRQTMAQELRAMRSLLIEDPDAARRQFDAWETHLIEALKLQAFR